jgi:hypothetical protein
MATLDTIPTITRVIVPLRRGEFDEREFYALPSFTLFLRQILPEATTGILEATETPREQMNTLLRKWNSGKPMQHGRMFQTMRPTDKHVWEMKTADIRVFGWMYRPKKFIAVFGGLADDFKPQNGNPPKESYDEARDRVLWNRSRLNLDPPLYVTGEYDALV